MAVNVVTRQYLEAMNRRMARIESSGQRDELHEQWMQMRLEFRRKRPGFWENPNIPEVLAASGPLDEFNDETNGDPDSTWGDDEVDEADEDEDEEDE